MRQIYYMQQREIIRMYFNSNYGIPTIAGIFNMKSSVVGKIILSYKKKYNIR